MTNVATIRDWHYTPPTNLRKVGTLNQSVDECLEVLVSKGIRYTYTEGEDYITIFSSVSRPYVYYWSDGQWASYRKKPGAVKHFTHPIKEFAGHYLNRYSGEKKVYNWPRIKEAPSKKKTPVKKAKAVKKKPLKAPQVVKKEEAKFLITLEVTPTEATRIMAFMSSDQEEKSIA